jgi:PAB-dependent poly(A)-specific ribonuclease subunit 2
MDIRHTNWRTHSDDSAQDLHSIALMGSAEIVVAGQQDKILSINMIRGIVTKKVITRLLFRILFIARMRVN